MLLWSVHYFETRESLKLTNIVSEGIVAAEGVDIEKAELWDFWKIAGSGCMETHEKFFSTKEILAYSLISSFIRSLIFLPLYYSFLVSPISWSCTYFRCWSCCCCWYCSQTCRFLLQLQATEIQRISCKVQ